MAREVISELVSVARIDTAQAAKEAAAHGDRLRKLKAAQDAVTSADKDAAAAATKLRRELIELKKVEVSGVGDKKALAKQAAEVRLRLQEQAEGARALREQQRALRDEQRALQASMRDTARAAKDAARAEVEAARAVAKAEGDLHRERQNWRRLQQSGARINDLSSSVAASDARLMRLRGPFGGLRVAAGDAIGRGRENWREIGGSAVWGGLRNAPSAAAGLGRAALGAAAGLGGAGVGAVAGIAARGSQFESLRASLETVEGSAQKAAASFQLIQTFAAQTPFTVEQATQSLIKLKALGLDASLPALKSYGDTASAMGKSLNDVVEAVADATTGEFERLKEFGIKAKSEGDKVSLTFRGVTTTIGKNSKEIEKYLIGIGQTQFAGGMERQAGTLQGRLSTLGDAVSQLADQAFQGGLGQALKDVVKDMTGAAEGGGDLAAVIGAKLGDAVRSTYARVKEFVGPVDELPAKFATAIDKASEFAGAIGSIAGNVLSLASGLDASTIAVTALGAAAATALGPLGKVGALGLTLGYVGGKLAFNARDALFGAAGGPGEQSGLTPEQRAAQQAQFDALAGEVGDARGTAAGQQARLAAAKAAGDRVARAELRALGATTAAQAAALPAAERDRIRRMRTEAVQSFSRQTAGGSLDLADLQGRADSFASGRERMADVAERERLIAARRKGKLSPSQAKRLTELSNTLDIATPTSAKGKAPKLNAFEAERKSEIDALVKRAELDAADRALASGNAGGAAEAARSAGKATRDRLTVQSMKGALPGEVERSLLRQAGFEDTKNTPPPPIVVYQQQFTVTVNVPLEAMIQLEGGSGDDVVSDLSARIKTILERDIVPATRESFRSAIRR